MPPQATSNAEPAAAGSPARAPRAAPPRDPGPEFRILGPMEVLHHGVAATSGRQKKCALLARLVLDANRTVSVESLVEGLWGDSVPPTAVKMIHVYVSQLRKMLPDGILRTRPPGYVLEVEPEAVDVLRFQRLHTEARAALAAGDPATAAARLRTALALWRGPALAEFGEPFAEVEAAHLDELRLTAIEDRIDADLVLARHRDVAGELQSLVARHPVRERLRSQWMLSLYRSGRHAEALAAYHDYARALRDELGIEPSAGLRALQYKILNQDSSLDAAAPPAPVPEPHAAAPGAPAATPPSDTFVGRVDELAQLGLALAGAAAGRGVTALISGPAGIGKTRLAGELAQRAREHGATVLTGRSIDLIGAALPFLPFVEALRPLRGSPALAGLHELSRLLPRSGGPASGERRGGESQLHLFEDVLAALDGLSAAAPVVLVLEDLHWADASTLDLLAYLASAARQRRILILASWRRDGTQRDDTLERLAAGLQRAGAAVTLELGPLACAELEALAACSGAPLCEELIDAVCARSEGNPFFARELLAAAQRGEDTLPRVLKDVLLADLARLDARSRSVVRVVAAAGRDVPHGLLRAAIPLPEREIVGALRDAVEQDVLVPDHLAGTYRFRHALLAEAAYATLLPGEREEVHERLARALGEAPGSAASGELAEHWLAAGRPGEALRASLQAAREAEAASGLSEALRHVEHVLALWDEVPRAEEVAGVAMPAVLAWATELAGAAGRCDDQIDARRLGFGDAADADAVAARLRLTEARELYPLVVVLESIAIRQSPRFDAAAIAELRGANERMRAALRDPYAAIVADDDFHRGLTAACGNEPLLAALRPVRRALLRYEHVYMLDPARIERSADQHDGIVAALVRGDHADAAQRLRRNLAGGLPDLAAALDG